MNKRRGAVILVGVLAATLGVIVGILGSPGRFGYDAFAELYHGEADTTGSVHVAVDCDTGTQETDDDCTVMGTDVTIAVTVGNSTGAFARVSYFNFRLTNDREDVFDPPAGVDNNTDGNPDFAQPSTGWFCFPPAPNPDENPNPLVSVSFISCAEIDAAQRCDSPG